MQKEEEKILFSRIEDLIDRVLRSGNICYSHFLDPAQASAVKCRFGKQRNVSLRFFGGFSESERLICGIYDDKIPDDEQFPITLLQIKLKTQDNPSHRDYLGAILALGIVRDRIGDISLSAGGAVVAVKKEVESHIIENLDSIGRYSIAKIAFVTDNIKAEAKYTEVRKTVASERLDCVIAAILNTSRTNSVEIIKKERVFVNYILVSDIDYRIKENSLISVRGCGRYKITELSHRTKKGRLSLLFQNYI